MQVHPPPQRQRVSSKLIDMGNNQQRHTMNYPPSPIRSHQQQTQFYNTASPKMMRPTHAYAPSMPIHQGNQQLNANFQYTGSQGGTQFLQSGQGFTRSGGFLSPQNFKASMGHSRFTTADSSETLSRLQRVM